MSVLVAFGIEYTLAELKSGPGHQIPTLFARENVPTNNLNHDRAPLGFG